MMKRRKLLSSILAGGASLIFLRATFADAAAAYPFSLSDAEWRKRLSPLAYRVLRKQATEHPFTSPLNKEHRAGTFSCAGCGQRLFSAKTKFDSGTGWPSFWAAFPRATSTSRDFALVHPRTEVHCSRCGGHLGHVFDDGPLPTGTRYCINGAALSFSAA